MGKEVKSFLAVLICLSLYFTQPATTLNTAQADAATIRVAPTGTDTAGCGSEASPCRTLQYAIDRAQSGDIILVAGGTYTYSGAVLSPFCYGYTINPSVACIIDKHLTMMGGYSPTNWQTPDPVANPTIIDGQNQNRGITLGGLSWTITKASLHLEGFRIQNGLAKGATSGAHYEISGYGGGMFTGHASFILREVTFQNNRAIGGNTNNSYGGAGVGGGLAVNSIPEGSGLLEHVTFENNLARGGQGPDRGGSAFGGGFYTWAATVNAYHITLTNNTAQGENSAGSGYDSQGLTSDGYGGAGVIHLDSSVTMQYVVANGNQAIGGNASIRGGYGHGGAFFSERAQLLIWEDAIFSQNYASGGNGQEGGLGGGGGVTLDSSDTIFNRTQVIANTARGGNGTSIKGRVGGGGIYAIRLYGNSNISILNSLIAENYIEMGSGIQDPGGGGGGLWLNGVEADITHSTIAGNRMHSEMGSGSAAFVHNFDTPTPSTVNISHSAITDHINSNPGPVPQAALHVWNGNTVNLAQGLFANNSNDTNAENDPPTPDGPGTFNGLATMIHASSADYMSPGYPDYNYHIALYSAAKDQAVGSGTALDIDNDTRPFGTGSDIGTDEYRSFYLSVYPVADGALGLNWGEDSSMLVGGVSHYEIMVTCETGANPPNEGGCDTPIDASQSTYFKLTGLSNFKEYILTVHAVGGDDNDVAISTSVTASPTDIFVYIPVAIR